MSPEASKMIPAQDAVSVWKQKKLEESRAYWRSMYQVDETNPYRKDKGAIGVSALRDALWKAYTQPGDFLKNLGPHIRAIDADFRGGVDIGDAKIRLQRMAAMAGNMVPYFVFDVVTSIPSGLLGEYLSLWLEKNGHLSKDGKRMVKSAFKGAIKIIDVQNDKVVTALGDIMASKRTGEKTVFTHEIWDKAADLGQTAAEDYLRDAINGPVLESVNRILYQVPIAGALWEQLCARITALQEKSALNKGIGKSLYMGVGTAIGVYRNMEEKRETVKQRKADPKAPSSIIARKIWDVVLPKFS